MSEPRASYALSQREPQEQPQQQHPPDPLPGLCELGAHVLEILEDETALIAKKAQMDETVLEKEELYRLLQALQELFQHGRV